MIPVVRGAVVLAVVCTIIALISVLLRFWSRALLPKDGSTRFSWDDWLALAATPAIIASTALLFAATREQLGAHIYEVTLHTLTSLLRNIYGFEVVFILTVGLPKLSALALYARAFGSRESSTPLWRATLWTTITLTVMWVLGALLATILQCLPIRAFWDPTSVSPRCVDISMLFVGTSVTDAIIHFPILLLPVQPLINLNIPRRQKLLIVGLFLVGYICPLLAIGRLAIAVHAGDDLLTDVSYSIVPIAYWYIVEYGLSVVTVCMPAIAHLVMRGRERGFRSLFTNQDVSEPASNSSWLQTLRLKLKPRRKLTPGHDEKIVVANIDQEKVPLARPAHEEKIPAVPSADDSLQYVPHGSGHQMTFEEALRMKRV